MPTNQQISTTQPLEAVARIETAFANNDCTTVLETARAAQIPYGPDAQSPVWTNLAIVVCAAEATPDDQDRAKMALTLIDTAEDTFRSLTGSIWTKRLRANRYRALRDRSGVQRALRDEATQRYADLKLVPRLELEAILIDTEVRETIGDSLANTLRELVNRASVAQTTDREDLASIEQLLATVTEPNVHKFLLQLRARLAAKQEENFVFSYLTALNRARRGEVEETRSELLELRRRFDAPLFTVRINGLIAKIETNDVAALVYSPLEIQMNTEATTIAGVPLTAEQALQRAREALDNGDPGRAVELLDSVPPQARDNSIARMRTDASNRHVMELRMRVRSVYQEAKTTKEPKNRMESLEQARRILQEILSRYPETSSRPGIERNIRAIDNEITELKKGS